MHVSFNISHTISNTIFYSSQSRPARKKIQIQTQSRNSPSNSRSAFVGARQDDDASCVHETLNQPFRPIAPSALKLVRTCREVWPNDVQCGQSCSHSKMSATTTTRRGACPSSLCVLVFVRVCVCVCECFACGTHVCACWQRRSAQSIRYGVDCQGREMSVSRARAHDTSLGCDMIVYAIKKLCTI